MSDIAKILFILHFHIETWCACRFTANEMRSVAGLPVGHGHGRAGAVLSDIESHVWCTAVRHRQAVDAPLGADHDRRDLLAVPLRMRRMLRVAVLAEGHAARGLPVAHRNTRTGGHQQQANKTM